MSLYLAAQSPTSRVGCAAGGCSLRLSRAAPLIPYTTKLLLEICGSQKGSGSWGWERGRSLAGSQHPALFAGRKLPRTRVSSCRFLLHHRCCHLVWLYYKCHDINPQVLGSCDYMRL